MRTVTVSAVIFDWGGTLTPWHTIDQDAQWLAICAPHADPASCPMAAVLRSAENGSGRTSEREHRSATLEELLSRAGVQPTQALLDAYFQAWEPHTFTDPDAPEVLRELRGRGIKIGVLSNTMWPRPGTSGSSAGTGCST